MLCFTGEQLLDRRGYYRSPVTRSAFRAGQAPANKGRRFPPEVLSPEEVYALLDACGRGPAGRRNRALIMLLWRAGLRCGEALALYPKDIEPASRRVTVLHGKGDKRRLVSYDPGAAAVLERWSQERARLGLGGRQPYFCVISQPTRGQAMHDAYVRALLKHLAQRAGIEKRVHPHGLRHSYAAYLMDSGVGIHKIKAMLGHSSIAVTERYVSHLSPSEVLDELSELPWPEPQIRARRAANSA